MEYSLKINCNVCQNFTLIIYTSHNGPTQSIYGHPVDTVMDRWWRINGVTQVNASIFHLKINMQGKSLEKIITI